MAMTDDYDIVPYPTQSFPQTHPDHLATLATLFGMYPAPFDRCRVLELGCNSGVNLIAMAFELPESQFVGIDRAAQPIAAGQEMVSRLELNNIALHQVDLMDVDTQFGDFDYIIAHGLYSWVPPPVRNQILALARAHLAPHGVAYVSYNAYPGAHLRMMLREMLMFHVRNIDDPQQRIEQAYALLKFLAASPAESDPYIALLKNELKRVDRTGGHYLFHDDLAEVNAPVYFHQFVRHAAQHDLQYLTEADYLETHDHTLPPHIAETFARLANDPVLKEQYADFFKGRRFRQTLLCHKHIALERTQRPEQMRMFYAASALRPASPEPEVKSSAVEEFRGNKGQSLAADKPLTKAALLCLSEVWPQSIHFDELLAAVRARLGAGATRSLDEDAQMLGEMLLQAYGIGAVELYLRAFRFVLKPGERPTASRLARAQIGKDAVVVNQRHETVKIQDELGRRLLLLLDGTRDRAALRQELATLVRAGTIPLPDGSANREEFLKTLPEGLETSLEELARVRLLTA